MTTMNIYSQDLPKLARFSFIPKDGYEKYCKAYDIVLDNCIGIDFKYGDNPCEISAPYWRSTSSVDSITISTMEGRHEFYMIYYDRVEITDLSKTPSTLRLELKNTVLEFKDFTFIKNDENFNDCVTIYDKEHRITVRKDEIVSIYIDNNLLNV